MDDLDPLMEVSEESADVQVIPTQASKDVTLTLVTSDSLSTEELLRSLADDPRVAFAEPNYYAELSEEGQEEAPEVVAAELASTDQNTEPATLAEDLNQGNASALSVISQPTSTIGDLTLLQWGNWNTTEGGVKPFNMTGNASINVPAFGTTGVGANMDKEVVVAVLDGPIDFTNPDLADRAYTFSPELQRILGCDEHGYNSSAESVDGKIVHHLDFFGDSHGTHCAGVIGAAWDGQGVSGVASNARIVSIQMMDSLNGEENGRTSLANGLRAFDFIKRANAAGVGIKVASCSWGLCQVSKALDAAVYDLGESQGVVSVFSAFNDAKDDDTHQAHVSTFADNPYAIVVAATNQLDATVARA